MGAYYLVKWFNQKEIPGIHTSLSDAGKGSSGEESTGNGQAMEPKGEPKRLEGGNKEHKEQKGSGKKEPNGVAGKLPAVDKVGDVGKSTGLDVGGAADVKKKADVGNVTKTAGVGDVAGKLPGGALS